MHTASGSADKDADNGHPDLILKETIQAVTSQFPRQKWSSCFAATIRGGEWLETLGPYDRAWGRGFPGQRAEQPADDTVRKVESSALHDIQSSW